MGELGKRGLWFSDSLIVHDNSFEISVPRHISPV